MTFLTLATGTIVFGLLWFFVPRASFMVVLTILLTQYYGINLFLEKPNSTPFNGIAGFLIVFIGIIYGLVMDIDECKNKFKH